MGEPSLGPPPPGDGGREMGGGSALANVELWVQQQNATLQEGPFSPSFGPSSQPLPPGHRPRPNGEGGNGPPRCCPGPHHPGGGEFGPGPGVDPMFGPQPPPGYAHDHLIRGIGGARVPDENLTPEQLQRREEQLAHIQKLKQMLFPGEKQGGAGFEGGPPQRFPGAPPPGMYGRPGQMDDMRPMPPHHHMMGPQPQRFMHHGCPQGMMGPPPPGMMDQPMPPDGMMMMGGMGPPFGEPGLPPNWDMMTPEEREWFRLQQDYYMEQRQKRHMQMQQMGGGPPPAPPGYFGDMPRQPPGRTSGPLSPVSPSFNGASPHDAQGFFFQGQQGMNFPPGRPNFGPNGPGGPQNFNPEFGPHPDGPFPPYGNPIMMQDPGQFPGGRFPPGCGKPKRKRASLPTGIPGAADRPGDDIFRHLQPAPSPQQFCSLNLFDGQELTITKQLNLAYQEPATSSPSTQPPSSTPPASAAPPSRKKKKTSAADVRIKSEAAPEAIGGPLSPGALRSASEAGDSTTDRPAASPSLQTVPRSSAGSGPITSATLASLARGVDALSDRIQADMLRGGPFGAVQMPEPDEAGEGDDRRSNVGGSVADMPSAAARNPKCAIDVPGVPGGAESGPPCSNNDLSPPSVKPEPGSSMLSPPSAPLVDPAAGARFNVSQAGNPSSVQSPSSGMVGNASVQIEPHAPNTIQYLPTRPPTTSTDMMEPPAGPNTIPPDTNDVYRQIGPNNSGSFCPNGPMMMPPGYEGPGPVPPGYSGGPMGRFEGPPGYGGPLSPGAGPRGCGPVQYPGDMMFQDGPGGPMPFPDGPMLQPGGPGGPVPYHGNRPMMYRGGTGPMPPQGGPIYRPGQPGVMMHQEFRDGMPDRHGQLLPMGGMRPNPGNGNQMMMMTSGRPTLPPDQPAIPANPAPARSRTESRSKKSKESKRRAEAAAASAAARQSTPVCDDPGAVMAGRDQRAPPLQFAAPGPNHGPPMGNFPGVDGPGVMIMDRMRPGQMMVGGDGSPSMRQPPGPEGPMMGQEEFDMMRHSVQSGMMPGDGRMMMARGMKPEMMMMGGKGGMRMPDEMMLSGGHPGMMQLGPRDMEMRPGSGMMGLNDMRPNPGMLGPGEMRPGSGMMLPGEMRPGSGMMVQGDGRPGSGMVGGAEMRPGSGMMGLGDMNVLGGSGNVCDTRPGSGLVAMSPRDDGSIGDGNRGRTGNGKSGMHGGMDGSRPESVGKRSEVEMMGGGEGGMRLGPGMMDSGMRPGSKMGGGGMPESDMTPGSGAGMEMMDGGMRPGSAMMMGMGPCDGRMRQGPEMVMGSDGNLRPGSALMMGMGQGDGNMRQRPDMMMGMDMMDMGMRPGSDLMMAMGPNEGGMRQVGGPMMMGMNPGDNNMRPGGPDVMMGMPGAESRMRPGSAAMMMGMGPGPDNGMMGPGDGGMMMMGPGGDGMGMMGMPGEFDPRGCPPEMMNAHRMGPMGPRMMGPGDMGMRYDGAGPMVPVRMNRPRAEMDFRMMGGMEPSIRGGPYAPGMRNGGMCPPDRQMMMMMGGGPNAVGPTMQSGEFGPGMGGPQMGGMGPVDGAQFQQFQQQLYATKGHHPQQGSPSPMPMMMDSRGGGGPSFTGYDSIQNGPPLRFGPPGSGVL